MVAEDSMLQYLELSSDKDPVKNQINLLNLLRVAIKTSLHLHLRYYLTS